MVGGVLTVRGAGQPFKLCGAKCFCVGGGYGNM